jgi:hypothetical protein
MVPMRRFPPICPPLHPVAAMYLEMFAGDAATESLDLRGCLWNLACRDCYSPSSKRVWIEGTFTLAYGYRVRAFFAAQSSARAVSILSR